MVKIHKMVLPFKIWLLITGISFVICAGFHFVDYLNSQPELPACEADGGMPRILSGVKMAASMTR